MPTQHKLSPAYNQPNPRQWFISCNQRDMSPYRCDNALRESFWEAFECAVQNAIAFGDTSITISWEYRNPDRMPKGKPKRWIVVSSDVHGITEVAFYAYALEQGRFYGGWKPITYSSANRLERLLRGKIPSVNIFPKSSWFTYAF